MGCTSRDKYLFDDELKIFDDKETLNRINIIKMLGYSSRIFKYDNLPETIHQKEIELQLQIGGYNIWYSHEGKLYTFRGGLGGEPDVYYHPTKAVIANPALRLSKTLDIDKDCVVMLNDIFYQGLMPIFTKYASLLTEAELSLKRGLINVRMPSLIQADNDNTYKSAVEYINKIENGNTGIIATKEFFEGISVKDFTHQEHLKEIIEANQYIKGSWFNEIGLNATFNMKREAINEAESTMNEDILTPFIDSMLRCRKDGIEKVNSMFNTNITVQLDSAWLQNVTENNLSLDIMRKEGGNNAANRTANTSTESTNSGE